jgi:integrase/recombinase XerD
VRQGKGRKDRTVPIGARALAWVARYVQLARPMLVAPPEHPTLFLSERGEKLNLGCLTNLMTGYVDRAKLGKRGACHIFRHSMATHMLERGADIRLIQEMLGHAETSTTAIYTRVSIQHLKRVHDATHPTALLEERAKKVDEEGTGDERREQVSSAELLSSLAAEAAEEAAAGAGSNDALAKTLGPPARRHAS